MSLHISAQVFGPVGTGVPITPQQSATDGQNLYYGAWDYVNWEFDVFKWNGFSWSPLPSLNDYPWHITTYQGELYAFTYVNTVGNIHRFRNGAWQSLAYQVNGAVSASAEYNGNLILGGQFQDQNLGAVNLLSFDGTNFSAFHPTRATDSIYVMEVFQNELWIGGNFYHGSIDTASVMKLNPSGNQWEYPAVHRYSTNFHGLYINNLFSLNGKVYTNTSGNLCEIRNDSLVPVIANTNGIIDHVNAGNVVIFTDYTSSLGSFDGSTINNYNNSPQGARLLDKMGSTIYGSFSGTSILNYPFNHVYQFDINNWGVAQGTIYWDQNQNCGYNQGEPIDFSAGFSYASGSGSQTVGAKGNYHLILPSGTYSLSGLQSLEPLYKYLKPATACPGQSSLNINSGQVTSQDIAFEHDGTADRGLRLNSASWGRLRQGFNERIYLSIENPGSDYNSPINVAVNLPSGLSHLSSSAYFTGQSANTLNYQLSGLNACEKVQIIINVNVSLSNAINDTLCLSAQILNNSDADLSNDQSSLCMRVVASYDPNDKTPNVGESEPGLSSLDYHIRFQNTGTDTAYKVVVVDSLESYFNPSQLELKSASHDYSFELKDGHILVWTFDNILLVDSNTNEAQSHGYITFNIGVDGSLPIGAQIKNDADIYFDFQAPIHTNEAVTTIRVIGIDDLGSAAPYQLYPNPAHSSEKLFIEYEEGNTESLKLYSSGGQLHKNYKLSGAGRDVLSLSGLAEGMYILKGKNGHIRIQVSH